MVTPLEHEHFFLADSSGQVRINRCWADRLSLVLDTLMSRMHEDRSASCWVYRSGGTEYFSLDLRDVQHGFSLTIMCSGRSRLDTPQGDTRFETIDSVDAIYLLSAILDALGASAQAWPSVSLGSFAGPSTIAR